MRSFLAALCMASLAACNTETHSEKEKNDTAHWVFGSFKKADAFNPILTPDSSSVFISPIRKQPVNWEAKDVFNPAAIVRHDTIFLLYRAEDQIGKYAGTSRIGLAWSLDGIHFTKHPVPVLYPDNDSLKKWEWEGGCEDPRIAEGDGKYYLTYTAYDGDKARLLIASSQDLYHWTKHGHVFNTAYNGKYVNEWSKSGSIVCNYENGKTIATKINGKYWMYWGDTDIFLASSVDLINWMPLENSEGKLISVFGPRKNMFDSDLVEPGPAAMLTDAGIVLIYNSRNVPARGDTTLAEGTYTVSQILLDKNDPTKVIGRMNTWFMKPDKDYETTGQVNHVCFAEGLVNYKSKWFLYYGTADSKIAVAIKE